MLPPPELEACNTRIALHMRRIAALLHNPHSSAHTPQVIGNTRAVVENGDFQRRPGVPALRFEACSRDYGAARRRWNASASLGAQLQVRARCSSYASHVSRVHVCPGANEQLRNFQASACSSAMKGREPNAVEVTRVSVAKASVKLKCGMKCIGAHTRPSRSRKKGRPKGNLEQGQHFLLARHT